MVSHPQQQQRRSKVYGGESEMCSAPQVCIPRGYRANASALSSACQKGKKFSWQKPHVICILETSKRHCLDREEIRGKFIFLQFSRPRNLYYFSN